MAVDSEDDLQLFFLQACQLFTELPEPPGVLVTEGLGLWSLDRAVRVVEASLSLQTLIHSAENGGLGPGLGGLNGPIRDQYSGHVICPDQSEASVTLSRGRRSSMKCLNTPSLFLT